MISESCKRALLVVEERLRTAGVRWALIGSTNMQVQGMSVVPRDLDVVVELHELERMGDLFSEYSPSSVRKVSSMTAEPMWEVIVTIGSVEVQIASELKSSEYVSKLLSGRVVNVKLDNVIIPCFSLEAESEAYAQTGREHKAQMIRAFLESQAYQ